MPRFADGVLRFQRDVYPAKRALFEKLDQGQTPEALFITCSDSRIETAMITQTEPGQLFICRNAGNIVPPHTADHTGGVTASLEYAVAVLKVPHIVICGHYQCGAMQGAMHPEDIRGLQHVCNWLGFAQDAVEAVSRLGADKTEAEKTHMLVEQNVILQMEHLRTHPAVVTASERGLLTVHGWIYDIGSGAVTVYDEATMGFIPSEQFYAPASPR